MIVGASYGNVSDFEIAFAIVSFFGFVFACINFKGINADREYLRGLIERGEIKKNGRIYLNRAAMVSESGRIFLQGTFLFLAYLAFKRPDPPPVFSRQDTVENAIARWMFFIGAVWVCAKTIYTWHVRRMLSETGVTVRGREERESKSVESRGDHERGDHH